MTSKTIGFLGFGNMGQAMARGFLRGGVPGARICACAKHFDKLQQTAEQLGITPWEDSLSVAERSDLLILAVKPYLIQEVLEPLKDRLAGKVVISVALGWLYDQFEEILPPQTHHLSIMPNTPVAIGEGVVLLEEDHSLTQEEYAQVRELLGLLGTVETVTAAQMGIAGTLSGCGPAYAAMFLEALGDAGVLHGLPRQVSYRLAAQMLAGTGKLHLATGDHPGAMKDAVCSPGGSTIRGVDALERHGFRSAVMDAITAAAGKTH